MLLVVSCHFVLIFPLIFLNEVWWQWMGAEKNRAVWRGKFGECEESELDEFFFRSQIQREVCYFVHRPCQHFRCDDDGRRRSVH